MPHTSDAVVWVGAGWYMRWIDFGWSRGYTRGEMRYLKTFLTLTVLTSLSLGVVPLGGICQMSQVRVDVCAMPCCDKANEPPSCPFIEPVARPDVIAVQSLDVTPVLEVVANLTFQDTPAPASPVSTLLPQPQIPKIDVCSTPQTLPAPPSLA
jgi:hypothetical protein